MTEAETTKLIDVIYTYYGLKKISDKSEFKMIIALWYNSFKDFDFSLVFNLLQQYIEVGTPFAPKISDLKDIYFKSTNTNLDCGEAWEQLMRNIRKYGIYNAKEGIKQLDELTLKALNSIGGYSNLCRSEDTTISDRAKFMENYKTYSTREREKVQLGGLQQKLAKLVVGEELGELQMLKLSQ